MFRKLSTYKSPFRYFLVVLCGYCVDFSIYAALVNIGVTIFWSNAVGFCVGSIVNTILIREFVFRDSRFSLVTDLQLSFGSNTVIFALGMAVLWIFVEIGAINPYVAKLLTNSTTLTVNYIIRIIIFRKK